MSQARKRSIGHIDVGDTQGSSLSTSDAGELRSRVRQKSLSGVSGPTIPNAPEKREPNKLSLHIEEFLWKRSWFIPLVIISFVFSSWYVIGGEWLDACVLLSYHISGTDLYAKGKKDIIFVFFYAIVFTFLREFIMQVILKPLAHSFQIRSKHKVNRFLEQTYSILYYGITGPAGLYLMYHTDMWYFNTRAFYENYPHREDVVGLKLFYLLQAAFWTQQAGVLTFNLEAKRKDFKELVFHHIVTLALISLSYRFHFTHIGLAVYITMDVSDFFLAVSKTLNYLDNIFTPPLFMVFVVTWAYLRHWINLKILWSVITEFRNIGPFELNWGAGQYKCWLSQYITFGLLGALQLVNIYWFVLIIRILIRYLVENEAKDVRSEDEEE